MVNRISSNVAIIIPIYKKYELLNGRENKLIKQVKSIFTNREIFIIVPESLEADWKQNSKFKNY